MNSALNVVDEDIILSWLLVVQQSAIILNQYSPKKVPIQLTAGLFRYSPLQFVLCAAALTHCAGEIPPSGGPVDTVPPKIIATYPELNSVGFSDTKVILEFDKYVEEQSLERSFFVSPSLGLPEFSWSGKQVEVRFPEKPREMTTYVVSIGTDVVDLRNRNRLEQSFTLAFSTGETIDSGSVSGRLFDDRPEGVMVFAYRVDSLAHPGINPGAEKPHYVTQSGKDGSFSLSHLRLATYRLFAVRDEFKNLLYDIGVDQIGIYWKDIELGVNKKSYVGVLFQLTKEDTARTELVSATGTDRSHIRLRFSKSIDPSQSRTHQFVIVDTLNSDRLEVRDRFVELGNPSFLTLVTATQVPKAAYRVTADSIFDSDGTTINPNSNSTVFMGAERSDSSAPRIISLSPVDSAKQVPLDAKIEIQFDDVVRREEFEREFFLSGGDGETIAGNFQWTTGGAVTFTPSSTLHSAEWYELRLPLRSLIDLQGNRGRDSVVARRFQALDENLLGSIDGVVIDESGSGPGAAIIVTASDVRTKGKVVYETRATAEGKFQLQRIVEGSYLLHAYRDDDASGKYSSGKAYPFKPSEVFSFHSDTVRVRARWPVEGITIRLK